MAVTFSTLLSERLNDTLAKTSFADLVPDDFQASVDQAQNRQFGDYQSNAAMILAKQVKKNPREVATEIAEAFEGKGLCEKPEIAGPGFINFRITMEALAERAAELLSDAEHLGVEQASDPQTIVLDFSAPNVANYRGLPGARVAISRT